MKPEKQLAKQIREIKEILPADYFAHLPLDARVRKMFEEWKQLESERQEMIEAAQKVIEGFEKEVFIRNTENDNDPGWAVKMIPYIGALSTLNQRTKNESERV